MPSSELELFFRKQPLSKEEKLEHLKIRAQALMSLFDEFSLPTLGQLKAPGLEGTLRDQAPTFERDGSEKRMEMRGLFFPVSPWSNLGMKPGITAVWRTWGITREKKWAMVEIRMVEYLNPHGYKILGVKLWDMLPEDLAGLIDGGVDRMLRDLAFIIEDWNQTATHKANIIGKVYRDMKAAEAAGRIVDRATEPA